jgi:hypothetical protein
MLNALARLAAAAVALTLLRLTPSPPPPPPAGPVDSRFMLEPLLYLPLPYLMLLCCFTSLRLLLLPAAHLGSPSLVLLLFELLPLSLLLRALRSRSSSLRRITCDFLRPAAAASVLPGPAVAPLLRRRSGKEVRLVG